MDQKKHWQSFGELNQSEAYNKDVKDEFKEDLPFVAEEGKSFLEAKAPRRDFLKYLGFSTAAAAVAASCEIPVKRPYPLPISQTILFRASQNIMLLLMCRMVM